MAMDLLSLAERCEKASGPDREIDGWIWAWLKAGEPYIIGNEEGPFPQKPIYGERADVMRSIGGKDGADYIGAPAYTASLDAAMMLVPEGRAFQIWTHRTGRKAGAGVDREQISAVNHTVYSAATPALALCAAALRARASVQTEAA